MAENPSTQELSRNAFIRMDDASGLIHAREYRLEIFEGPDAGRSLLIEGTLRVGSAPGADLQLNDPAVSRFHLKLCSESDGVRVEDLGSTNGTFVEGARITQLLAIRPTTLELGRTQLKIIPIETTVPFETHPRSFGPLLGHSPATQRLSAILSRVACSDVTTLLLGETGTGKSFLAQAMHQASTRRGQPFITIHAGDLTDELAESQLFGHAAGAFTGATQERAGLIQQAQGGTLFLDEVASLTPALQTRLLRVLESGKVRPVGANEEIPVDVRWMTATQTLLENEVQRGNFRRDLYYRLAVALVQVPPLRERREDLPALASQFAKEAKPGGVLPGPLPSEWLAHPWPGNVRELRNAVERWMMGFGTALTNPRTSLPLGESFVQRKFKDAKEEMIQAFEREYLERLIDRHHGNIAKAAEDAGLARTYLYSLLKKQGLSND